MNAKTARAATRESPDIVLFGDFQSRGGTERRLANMVPVWTGLGFRVQIVGYRTAVPFYADELGDAEFVHLGTRSRIATVIALWRYLRRHSPRAIIATGHIGNTILARVCKHLPTAGTRCLLNIPNDFVASRKNDAGMKRARKLREVKEIYRAADGIITAARGVTDNLAEHAGLTGVPVYVIPNANITQAVLDRSEEAVAHPWLTEDRSVPTLLSVGRLAQQKDYPTLIRAFSAARSKVEARLIILGEGPERERIESLARELGVADHVSMPGFVENPYAWMRQADVFVLSSEWEGFPNVLSEALGLGTPVVATDCASGPNEILAGGRYGRLVRVGDHEALAQAATDTLTKGPLVYDPVSVRQPFTDVHAAQRYLEVCGLVPPAEEDTALGRESITAAGS